MKKKIRTWLLKQKIRINSKTMLRNLKAMRYLAAEKVKIEHEIEQIIEQNRQLESVSAEDRKEYYRLTSN